MIVVTGSQSHENVLPLLCECPKTRTFWQAVIGWWNEKRSENAALNATYILYGYKLESNFFDFAKYNIFGRGKTKPLPALKFSACYSMKRSFVNVQFLLKVIH